MYTVYKHLDEDENILYIGKSKSLLYRQRQHKKNAEWFEEVDSIEYCTLSSKSEMDLVEVYLINTLSPKYNKKGSRNDDFVSLKLDELNWLQFDMCELFLIEDKNNIKKYSNEDFIESNINNKMLIGLIEDGINLYEIHGINKKLKLIKNNTFNRVFKFSDIMIYQLDSYSKDFKFNCLYNDDNEHLIKNHIYKTKLINHAGGGSEVYIGKIKVKSNKDIYYESLDWDE